MGSCTPWRGHRAPCSGPSTPGASCSPPPRSTAYRSRRTLRRQALQRPPTGSSGRRRRMRTASGPPGTLRPSARWRAARAARRGIALSLCLLLTGLLRHLRRADRMRRRRLGRRGRGARRPCPARTRRRRPATERRRCRPRSPAPRWPPPAARTAGGNKPRPAAAMTRPAWRKEEARRGWRARRGRRSRRRSRRRTSWCCSPASTAPSTCWARVTSRRGSRSTPCRY